MVKVGDRVILTDESYCISLLPDGVIKSENVCGGAHTESEFTVVATGGAYPSATFLDYEGEMKNDALLWNNTKKYYICTQVRFLKKLAWWE